MRIEIRGKNEIMIDGYVNVVQRDSRMLSHPNYGNFVEQIVPKTFEKFLGRGFNVDLLFNHKKDRKLGSLETGNLKMWEDSIGLRAVATITDPEVIQKAKNKQLTGWSFSFRKINDHWENKNGVNRRYVDDLHLVEVSLLDEIPAYPGTSIELRAALFYEIELMEKEIEILKLRGGMR